MCGRTVTIGNFNHCPTQQDLIETANGRVEARWGLHFPHFLINARDDTNSQRFRQLRERNRCVVDALGYYEWKTKDGSKQPYYITSLERAIKEDDAGIDRKLISGNNAGLQPGEKVLKFAGMYDVDKLGDGKLSYVTMTCSPSEPLSEIHDRMPVILNENDVAEWLSEKPYAQVAHLVKPYEKLAFFPVSTFVNDVRNNGPECIKPVTLKKSRQSKLEFRNGVLITPEKKKRKINLGEPQTSDNVVKMRDKLDEKRNVDPLKTPAESKEIIDLSDGKSISKPQLTTPRKTTSKKLPKNQPSITKFFSST